ncbi:aldehyde dehydrogenase family protein [Paraburkholderia atlantica]|uniref:aldehyde dehydrogenase family protein n=1 Tax=Paraburkholderia atlantica TaxID=2654982 RepID=UPI00036B88E7|nr:aldehyde dehydrogenase family protein [Paraburkholderia atlantica]
MSLSPSHQHPLDVPGRLFIGGAFVEGDGVASVEHVNPSTGRSQATVRLGSASDIDHAVKAAKAAQRVWMEMGPRARTRCFRRLGELLEANQQQLAFLGARESGIPVGLPLMDMALGWVDHYMGWIDKIEGSYGESYPAPGFNYTRREPYGVVGVIIPWNGPLMATCMMALPAIAAGNGVVLKPPALAPFVALRIAELAHQAGLPAGLFNVVPGEAEAGEALVAHPDVAKVTFTGGEGVARRVMATAAACLKPVALELGGKSANLVFEDADLDAAAIQAVYGALGLSGQGCVNPTRLLVHRSRYDEMVARVAAVAASMKVGDPFDSATVAGPVICQSACDRILGIIAQARRDAKLVAGGERLGGELANGFFIQPTVFADVQPGSALEQNEVFGPVLSITPFADDAEALAIANGTRYGLGAYLHTNDLDRAHAFAERLDAGYVNINGFAAMAPGAPFGGYRQSGFGRVGGWAGMEEYLQLKNVFVARREGKR